MTRARWSVAVAAALVAFALGGCATEPASKATGPRGTAVVTRHTDGDTVWLSKIGKTRLIGVDTPEVYGQQECFGKAASRFTERALPIGATVTYRLGTDPQDRYGRALAYVWLKDGRMLNSLLVQQGYATPLTIAPNVEYADRFLRLARAARQAGRGLWRACR